MLLLVFLENLKGCNPEKTNKFVLSYSRLLIFKLRLNIGFASE